MAERGKRAVDPMSDAYWLEHADKRIAELEGDVARVRRDLLDDVRKALEDYYDPQLGEWAMHPADFVTKRFELDGHEGLEYL